MDYEKIYNDLVSNRKRRGLVKERGFEIHHILPRCLGGTDENNNLVKLTYREHFLAHRLLPKFVTGIAKGKLHGTIRLMAKDKKRFYSRDYAGKEGCNSVVTSLFHQCKRGLDDTCMLSIHRRNLPKKVNKFTESLAIELGISITQIRLAKLEVLLSSLKYATSNGYSQFAFSSYGTSGWRGNIKTLKGLISLGYLSEISLDHRLPAMFKFTDEAFRINLKASAICTRSPIYTCKDTGCTFDPEVTRSLLWFVSKVANNRYIVYPKNLRDVLLLEDSNYVNNLLVKIPRSKMLKTLKCLDEYITGVVDNCKITKEK
ncbi:putative homing endonuclease [Vibrio phage 277E43-1]|nr:putative homing endonuclease [Vibrio phage 277E43-1]